MIQESFRECASCAAKPGTPVLCEVCLHNQKLESDYRHERRAVVDLVRRMHAVVERAIAERPYRSHQEDAEADNLREIAFIAEAFLRGARS